MLYKPRPRGNEEVCRLLEPLGGEHWVTYTGTFGWSCASCGFGTGQRVMVAQIVVVAQSMVVASPGSSRGHTRRRSVRLCKFRFTVRTSHER